MTDTHWQLDIAPSAREAYEGMVVSGRGLLRGRKHLMVVLQSVFIGFFAPLGATMMFWIIVQMSGGPAFSALPAMALPITYVVFGWLTFWLMRQSYYMIAQASVASQFGRAYSVLVDHTGITLTTQHSVWRSGWGDVALVRGGRTTLAVAISGISIVLPKRVFLGPDDAAEALTTMQSWHQQAMQ